MREVRVGMLGSGFIGEFHTLGLRYVPDARVVANWGAGSERREAFGRRFDSRPLDSIDAVCADSEVDLVVVSLPNHLHLEAVRSAAANGKAVACTKPLGRSGTEAAEMLRLVTDAGVTTFTRASIRICGFRITIRSIRFFSSRTFPGQ